MSRRRSFLKETLKKSCLYFTRSSEGTASMQKKLLQAEETFQQTGKIANKVWNFTIMGYFKLVKILMWTSMVNHWWHSYFLNLFFKYYRNRWCLLFIFCQEAQHGCTQCPTFQRRCNPSTTQTPDWFRCRAFFLSPLFSSASASKLEMDLAFCRLHEFLGNRTQATVSSCDPSLVQSYWRLQEKKQSWAAWC